ncbi:unnamed protein product [Brassica oleracea var. botrytis]
MSSSKKEQSSEPPSLIPLLPEDILSRVRWCDYRTLSLVSKHFQSLVASHVLYARRSLLAVSMLPSLTEKPPLTILIFSAWKPTIITAWSLSLGLPMCPTLEASSPWARRYMRLIC